MLDKRGIRGCFELRWKNDLVSGPRLGVLEYCVI